MALFSRRPAAVDAIKDAWDRGLWDEVITLADAFIAESGGNRTAWLLAASALERKQNLPLSSNYTSLANRLHPAPGYDSTAAYAAYSRAPFERDEVAEFILENLKPLRSRAEAAVSAAGVPHHNLYVYWDTPERPAIVDLCIASVHEFAPSDARVVELNGDTAASLTKGIEGVLPLIESPAHRSDLIRLELLSSLGGTWIDSTCLLRPGFEHFHRRIAEQDFFAFTYRGSRTGNWFLHATPSSYRLQMIRATMRLWLETGHRWTNYFTFHDIVEMLYWTDDRYRAEWDRGLFLHPREALEVGKNLTKKVPEHEWLDLLQRSPINRLSWKFPAGAEEKEGTVLHRLLAR